MGNLEVIARNRWHEPLASWPTHNENHKATLAGSSIFDEECLRCWLERVAVQEYENISRVGSDDYMNYALRAMLSDYILGRVAQWVRQPGAFYNEYAVHFVERALNGGPVPCYNCEVCDALERGENREIIYANT